MNTPTLVELLKAGSHFGHQKSKRHPNMERFIYTTRNNVSIIDLESTQTGLEAAGKALSELAAAGKTILFVGTKNQASALVEQYAKSCGMPYVNSRWLGGFLTNFDNVVEVPKKLAKLKADRESGELKKYTKKEQLEFDREITRLDAIVGGVEGMDKLPDAVFIVDLREEKTALREALQLKIPVFAVCDSNTDPMAIEYPIPANDDAIRSIDLILNYSAQAISAGSGKKASSAEPSVDAAAEQPAQETPAAEATTEDKN